MRDVLVTGGAGFIGSALVRGLLEEEGIRRVVVLDNLFTGKRENLSEVESAIEFHQVDLREYAAMATLFSGIDTVFHQAAVVSVPRSIQEPDLTHDVNVNGTFNVFLAAQRKGVRRVVYASSSAVYGDTPVLPKIETMPPDPKSPYATHKVIAEQYAKTFWRVYGVEMVGLRYFNVFGPRQDPTSPYSGVLSLFSKALLQRRSPTIHGDGQQSRDFTFVDNIVRLNILAALSPKAPGNVYNGGIGGRYTLNDTWAIMQQLEGVEIQPNYAPPRQGDVQHSQADLTAAKRDLNYEPLVAFQEGLRRTLDWYQKNSLVCSTQGDAKASP